MPYKARLNQKTWQVLTRPYIMHQDSPVIKKEIRARSACHTYDDGLYSTNVVRGDDAWTVYKETTSFLEVKAAVREILYDVGLKKEHIQVIELVDHDYIITPLT